MEKVIFLLYTFPMCFLDHYLIRIFKAFWVCWLSRSNIRRNLRVFFFFSIRVSFTDTDDSQDSRGREGAIFYSTLPLPPALAHSDIYLQLCMWDDYHIFLIAPLVFTRLLLDEIYHLIELPFDSLMMWD